MLGLCCCVWAFSSCGEGWLLFLVVCGLLIAVASLVEETGSRCAGFNSCGSQALKRRLSSCGAQAYLLCGMWDLPGLGIEPVSPALAGRLLTTLPPGKSQDSLYLLNMRIPAINFQKPFPLSLWLLSQHCNFSSYTPCILICHPYFCPLLSALYISVLIFF